MCVDMESLLVLGLLKPGLCACFGEGPLPPCLMTGEACVYVTIYILEETRETLISLLFNPDEFLHFPAVRHGIFMLRLYC